MAPAMLACGLVTYTHTTTTTLHTKYTRIMKDCTLPLPNGWGKGLQRERERGRTGSDIRSGQQVSGVKQSSSWVTLQRGSGGLRSTAVEKDRPSQMGLYYLSVTQGNNQPNAVWRNPRWVQGHCQQWCFLYRVPTHIHRSTTSTPRTWTSLSFL
jgi:hypothetical protein